MFLSLSTNDFKDKEIAKNIIITIAVFSRLSGVDSKKIIQNIRPLITANFGFFEISRYNCLAIIVSKYTLVVEGGSLNESEAITLTHYLIPFEGYEWKTYTLQPIIAIKN
jgi:hypothetical protein